MTHHKTRSCHLCAHAFVDIQQFISIIISIRRRSRTRKIKMHNKHTEKCAHPPGTNAKKGLTVSQLLRDFRNHMQANVFAKSSKTTSTCAVWAVCALLSFRVLMRNFLFAYLRSQRRRSYVRTTTRVAERAVRKSVIILNQKMHAHLQRSRIAAAAATTMMRNARRWLVLIKMRVHVL